MKVKKMSIILLGCLGFAMAAQANEVRLSANQATKITYRVVHQNQNGQAEFGAVQTVNVGTSVTVIPVDLKGYDLVGISIVSSDGHELPSSANQFNQPRQCSMTTNIAKPSGALEFTVSPHSVSCHTIGGLFG